jgi:hypothetical protein
MKINEQKYDFEKERTEIMRQANNILQYVTMQLFEHRSRVSDLESRLRKLECKPKKPWWKK